MGFSVGDIVIHKRYGLGEVIQMDQKELSGRPRQCYVVRIGDLTMWVPADEPNGGSLRPPTPRNDFENLFAILRSTGEPLSNDRFERKTQLHENMKDGDLAGICRVIRDLTSWGASRKLNIDDRSVLERAQIFLVNEWMLTFSVSQTQAQRELYQLLGT
jgi:CarD family transcriptional regulator